MCCPMAYPCSAPTASVRSTSMSSVPGRTSPRVGAAGDRVVIGRLSTYGVRLHMRGRRPASSPATTFRRILHRAREPQSVPHPAAPPELPALLVRTDAVAHRHVDAEHGAGLAGP